MGRPTRLGYFNGDYVVLDTDSLSVYTGLIEQEASMKKPPTQPIPSANMMDRFSTEEACKQYLQESALAEWREVSSLQQ